MLDKLLPFLLNLATEGRTWREQGITAPMVRAHNRFIAETDPELYAWFEGELERAVRLGWLPASQCARSPVSGFSATAGDSSP